MNIRQMARCALFAALMAVCAMLTIPLPGIRISLQTFAMVLCLVSLGGKWGSRAIGLYLLLGLVGLPVFSGFRGGPGALLDVTGGFIWGFGLGAVCYRLLEKQGRGAAISAFYLVCYGCGCLWFHIYTPGATLWAAVMTCVVPYIIPEIIKAGLALFVAKRIGKYMK